ncbi:MAG: acyloxyacyl hydrolase [Nitrospiraceae bacterium]|nr:acyloxyacyl hydrolase [Nitrospira sp.]MCA9456711.1 acyloxyacyl hydrolase [Nitrospira sp.]MCB9773570.1 acyloxyacyl hydrolase [Nitrospiraceae bacterium]
MFKGFKREQFIIEMIAVLLMLLMIGTTWGADVDARNRVTKGTLEFGFLTGYWQGNNAFGNEPSANRSAVYFLPQLGLVLTDEIGSGLTSGNVEVLIEPLAAHYYQPFSASAFGGSLMVKYNFLDFGRWMPFWDGGAGMLWTDLGPRIPEQSTQFNFVLQTGPGVSYFVTENTSVTVGIRFHHISNAGIGDRNIGLNGCLFNVGISFFSP